MKNSEGVQNATLYGKYFKSDASRVREEKTWELDKQSENCSNIIRLTLSYGEIE